jgi:glutaredoxin 3
MPRVEIYTNGSCAFCVAAKLLLKQNGLAYEDIRVDTDPRRFEEMLGRSQRRSVPQVFIDGDFVGGYEELAEAVRGGRLAGVSGGAA